MTSVSARLGVALDDLFHAAYPVHTIIDFDTIWFQLRDGEINVAIQAGIKVVRDHPFWEKVRDSPRWRACKFEREVEIVVSVKSANACRVGRNERSPVADVEIITPLPTGTHFRKSSVLSTHTTFTLCLDESLDDNAIDYA